jgi:hypothetical protein
MTSTCRVVASLVGVAVAAMLVAQSASKELPETDVAREQRMSAKYGVGYLSQAPSVKLGNKWSLAPWSGDVRPYERARRMIEAGVSQAEVLRLGQEAKTAPNDPVAQFRWVLAELQSVKKRRDQGERPWDSPQGSDRFGHMRWGLAVAPDPHVAEYSRLRFLVEAPQLPVDSFRVLARKLRDRWPDDRSIKLATARLLLNSSVPKDFDTAIGIADELLKVEPNRPLNVGLKRFVHMRAWFKLHRRADGLAAIEWNDRYFALTPGIPGDKEALARIMNFIRQELSGAKKT